MPDLGRSRPCPKKRPNCESIIGSVDGLVVTDSLGGEPLAQRLGRTDAWQEFVLYRVATHADQLNVRFALTGLGEAWIDDVSIQQVQPRGMN